MFDRYWVAVGAGLLCLWSCSSSCGPGCDMCQSAPEASGCASSPRNETSSGGASTSSGASAAQHSTTASSGSGESAGEDTTATNGNESGVSDDTANETDDATNPTDDATNGTDDSASTEPASDDTNDTAATETSEGGDTESDDTSNDQTSVAPVNPEDPTSDSSTRFKTVPVGESASALGYWEYLPPNYDAAPAPLLVFTHGASWQGDGSEEALQELLTVGPVNLISEDLWPNARPFVVLAPQNSHSGCFTAEDIDGFYRYALDTYNIDTSRIYHTGQSCGAIGGWNYLAAHLDEFVTAAVLIAGDGQDAFDQAGCDLGRVAIWGLHNEKDGSVDSAGTINPITDLTACDPAPDVKLTIYPDATEHDAWTKTYDLSAGNDIYSWLLEHTHE